MAQYIELKQLDPILRTAIAKILGDEITADNIGGVYLRDNAGSIEYSLNKTNWFSLLDASKLGGQDPSYYLAWANLTGKPSPVITLAGDASGSVTLTSLGSATLTITVLDDSHNHVISNVDGLQTALDAKLASASYTAADVLAKLLTVDGTGSLLDADKLDGQEGSYYLSWANITGKPSPVITLGGDATGSVTLTSLTSGTLTVTIVDDSHNHVISNVDGLQTALDAKLASASYTAADVLAKLLTVDGTGTGLDADKLDGYHLRLTGGTFEFSTNGTAWSPAISATDILSALLTVDGTGTGLDADKLDGVEGSSFARKDQANTFSGNQTINGELAVYSTGDNGLRIRPGLSPMYGFTDGAPGSLIAFINEQGAANQAFVLGDTTSGNEATLFGVSVLDTGGLNPTSGAEATWTPRFRLTGTGKGYLAESLIMTQANGGAGSLFDADKLDGQEGSYYLAWANITGKPSPVITLAGDASGSVTLTSLGSGTLTVTVEDDSHNHVISNVDGLQTALDAKLAAASYTAADVLSKILTVDGSGSGLDADKLDGYHLRLTGGTFEFSTNGTAWSPAISAADMLAALLTVDGTGTGLDADKVDGIEGASIARKDQANTFSGNQTVNGEFAVYATGDNGLRIRTNLTSGYGFADAGGNIITFINEEGTGNQAFVLGDTTSTGTETLFGVSVLDTGGANPTTGAEATWIPRLRVTGQGKGYLAESLIMTQANGGAGSLFDADKLDGQEGSYYLSWANITGKPSPVITLGGDASGSVTLTSLGSGTLTVTVADDSHNHVISNVDGLQTALDAKLASASYTAADVLAKLLTVDGAGTGLDADKLDGQEGSYYLDWTNATNKPSPVITLAGDTSGSVTLTSLGSGTLTVTVLDDSHNHVISNVDGLQTALDGKMPLAGDSTKTGILTVNAIRTTGTTTDYSFLFRNSTGAAVYVNQGGAGDIINFATGATAGSGVVSKVTNDGSFETSGSIKIGSWRIKENPSDGSLGFYVE